MSDIFNGIAIPNLTGVEEREKSGSVIGPQSIPNSMLTREQSDAFINKMVDLTTILRMARIVKMNRPTKEINKLDIGRIVTEGANTTSRARTRIVDESVIPLTSVKYRSAYDFNQDTFEDNLEGEALRNKVVDMMATQVANDIELAAIQSDSTILTGDAASDENNLLGVNDGWRKDLLDNVPNAQILECGGAAPSEDLYYDMINALPPRYSRMTNDYKWLVPIRTYNKWWKDIAARQTQLGDEMIVNGELPGAFGVGMVKVTQFPEDLTYGTVGTDSSDVWLTPPSNLIYAIQRDIKLEWERVPRTDSWEATVHTRIDFAIENPDLVVMATGLKIDGADYVSGAATNPT